MGAPTLAGLAAAISIAMRPIEVRELSFRLFNGDQRPVTVLRSAVTENAGGHRMRGATSKNPGKRTEQSAPRPEYGRGTGVPNPIDVEVGENPIRPGPHRPPSGRQACFVRLHPPSCRSLVRIHHRRPRTFFRSGVHRPPLDPSYRRLRRRRLAWPSIRPAIPARSSAEACTKISLPPRSEAIKPNPFMALYHLTVPDSSTAARSAGG